MLGSADPTDERRTWIYAFLILVLVSLWISTMRILSIPFLALDFEIALIYLPTILAGVIVAFYAVKRR